MSYDVDKWFFDDPVRREPGPPPPFEYRARSYAQISCRISQNFRGVPAIAPRSQGDDLCRQCGLRRDQHGRRTKLQRNPFRACERFQSPYVRARKRADMHQNSDQEQ
jgi:hypothetical protein